MLAESQGARSHSGREEKGPQAQGGGHGNGGRGLWSNSLGKSDGSRGQIRNMHLVLA